MIKSVLLDTSFIIRLVNKHDSLHEQAVQYYKFFIDNQIEMYLSTIALAEYSVKDDPANLPLKSFKIIPFDFFDAKKAGEFFSELKKLSAPGEKNDRDAIKDDCKMIAQIYYRKIDAFISKDGKAHRKYIQPLSTAFRFELEFINLEIPLREWRGELF